MTTSARGIALIKSFEGLCAKAYKLPGEKYYTIGYGHYGADVKATDTVTTAQAEALLAQDLKRFEGYVTQYVPFKLNQNQFDALVSFTYNLGPGNLTRLVSNRTAADVPTHILYYTNSASEAYRAGLLRRRKAELALYLEPVVATAVQAGAAAAQITEKPKEEEPEMTKAEIEALIKSNVENAVEDAIAHALPVYGTINDVPEWYRAAVQKLIDKGALKGVDATGETLNLSRDLCRVLTVLDRLGVFD